MWGRGSGAAAFGFSLAKVQTCCPQGKTLGVIFYRKNYFETQSKSAKRCFRLGVHINPSISGSVLRPLSQFHLVLIWEVGGWEGLKEQLATATSCSNLQSATCFFFFTNCDKIDELDFESETWGCTTALFPILREDFCFGNIYFFQTVCNEPECHFIS